jgi:hypothetical protein
MFALNTVGGAGTPYPNIRATGSVVGVCEGNNRYDHHTATSNNFAFNGAGDELGPPDYVVTSVADTFDNTDNEYSLSTREAIALANDAPGAEELWIPAWKYFLTRGRTAPMNMPEMDIEQGDLDIKDSLTIRGINALTSVAWSASAALDAVFDLPGDYNGDGIANGTDNGSVGTEDYAIWLNTYGSTTDLRADGDDNGVVDQADYDVWTANYGNTLVLDAVLVS